MITETLKQLYYTKRGYPTDKGSVHSYLGIYDSLFLRFKHEHINILEVGIFNGGSIKLWEDYFPYAHIYGYDIVNQTSPQITYGPRVRDEYKDFNLVPNDEIRDKQFSIAIDDGSHTLYDQMNFVKKVYSNLKQSGILIVEDIQDIDNQKTYFNDLNIPYTIIDLRRIKNRYDDVLLLFEK